MLKLKNITPRFRWPINTEQAEKLLTAAYSAEVECRHARFIHDKATIDNIHNVAAFITADKPKFGILLCGNPGNGKTTMLQAFQNATNYLVRLGLYDRSTQPGNIGVSIVDARDIVYEAKDYKAFKKVKTVPMLAIEDIGREPTEVLDYGNILNPVVDLLECRYRDQLFTFITTNLTPRQIREKYGNRIADRFNEMMQCVVFKNATYRLSEK